MSNKYLPPCALFTSLALFSSCKEEVKQPNVVFVFTDQWRYQATTFAGDVNVRTPNIDKLSTECITFSNAYSCVSASTPYRGSLMTGQYPITTGLFLNDVKLNPEVNSIGKVYAANNYNTAYVGKWHLNGSGRSAYIPEEERLGFQYFKGLECSHEYNESAYYDNNDTTKRYWEGYDAFAQVDDVINYMSNQKDSDKPFMLMLSLGAPHNPYNTAPEEYRAMYEDVDIVLRPNVPESKRKTAIDQLRGYYAHIAAVDAALGILLQGIKDLGIEEETIFVLTSDHGDMLMSQDLARKQKPYEESIHIPFMMKYPAAFGKKQITTDVLINVMDVMPTLLGLCGLDIPESVEGINIAPILLGQKEDDIEGTLIESVSPFGEFHRMKAVGAGREYRGVRTKRYTYVRDLEGPWLLFDNHTDPYQMTNIINDPSIASTQSELDALLNKLLAEQNDEFLHGDEYIKMWGHVVDRTGTAPYKL